MMLICGKVAISIQNIPVGIYSRGKSHVLRMAVPIQLLLNEFKPQDANEVS